MKRAFVIILTAVFVFAGIFPVSAAQPQKPKKTVYIASQPVPKAAAEYVRGYFSTRMPAQDICDFTGLTVEQVKKVRLCPAFRAESFESEASRLYHFPLIYEDTFVGTLTVFWNKGTGYTCQLGAGDDFLAPLNTLSSSVSAPLMFIYTNDSCFVMDSKNKVTLLRSYPPYSEKEIERQMLDMPKMERPSRVVALSADIAYPERISSAQIADEEPVLIVKNETEKLIYTSESGGKTWKNNAKPPVYISIDKTYFPKEDGKISYTIHNNTKSEQGSDIYFTLQKWDGQKWGKCPETDGLEFIDIALILAPNSSQTLDAAWGQSGIKLEAGRYKLIKKLYADDRKFTCEVVFCLT